MKKIVICGDSFSYGIGCVNLNDNPYGVLIARHFGWDLIRLARGSASNYTIYLQGMYAADMPEPPHLVILGQTSYDRIEWFSEEKPDNFWTHSLVNLNYHLYPPHHEPQRPYHTQPMDYYLRTDSNYAPCMLSEQIGGIDHCLETRRTHPKTKYYERLDTEPNEKLKLIVDHYLQVNDYSIKKNYDIGMLFQAYSYIKRKGINCIIMTEDVETFAKYMDRDDLMYQCWGIMAQQYPDTIGSMHASEEAHKITSDRLIEKIKELKID